MTSETQTQARNEPAERLRERLHRDMQHGLAMEADIGLDLALREQTRITVDEIREHIESFSRYDGSEILAVLDEVATLPYDRPLGEKDR